MKLNKFEKISVCYGCKNREENLLVSIKSIIKHDFVDDIVVVDFNSDRNIQNFLKHNVPEQFFKKINVVIEKLGIKNSGYRIITNSGSDGGQEVPHFHVHILGGEKMGSKIK